jgi:hypothetical protein
MATSWSNLDCKVEEIQDRPHFVEFVRDLIGDLRTNPGKWENHTLESYLEAVAAWAEDCEGYYKSRGETAPQTPSWKFLGELLLAAKLYE